MWECPHIFEESDRMSGLLFPLFFFVFFFSLKWCSVDIFLKSWVLGLAQLPRPQCLVVLEAKSWGTALLSHARVCWVLRPANELSTSSVKKRKQKSLRFDEFFFENFRIFFNWSKWQLKLLFLKKWTVCWIHIFQWKQVLFLRFVLSQVKKNELSSFSVVKILVKCLDFLLKRSIFNWNCICIYTF